MTMTTREETIGQVLALLGATSDAEDQKWVRELTSKILDHGEHVRDMLATEQAVDARQTKLKGQELMQDRQQIYEKLESANMNERYQQLPHLHQLSKSIRQLNAQQPAINLELESMMAAMEGNLLMLQELVGDGQELPWRLRFVTDVDPLSNQPITFGGDDTILTDSDGNLVWSDHCGTCRYELGHDDPRWRCMACAVDGVQCDQCHTVFSNVHSNCHPGCVHEQQHPVFARLDTRVKDSLSQTLLKIFQAWSIRPCFHAAGQADWLTYRQVLHRALQVSTFLLEDDATELLLCFPAGSMEYYFWDIGAALVGVPTIGLSTSPIPTEIPPTSHVACHPTVKTKLNIPTSCKLVALQDTEEYDPKHEVPIGVKDAPDDLYTTYFTSGSTGKPKPIYNTRKELLEDLIVLRGDPNPKCTLSFQPSCWASDRNLVYTTLFNGGRVGFSRLSPSLSEIVEDIAEVEPTFLSVPPVLLQFIHSLNPPLGSRLSYVTTGGAPVGTKIMHAIAETYGVEVTESYGTTECGGIAVDGQILPDQRSKIRVRDPVTGEWLCSEVGLNNDDGEPRSSSIVGELWVGDHNTQDIVELVGSNIQVLGRSGSASSFKASNGKWCSLVDIEDEIMQSCFPELLFEAFVFEQSPGRLVLVARTETAAVTDGARILAQVRKRSMLSPEMLPLSIVLTRDAFPKTVNLKIKRDVLANKFREEANHPECLVHTGDEGAPEFSDAAQLASRVLGHSVDPKVSFLENGGDSLTAVRWLHELKVNDVDISHENWRSILSSPLEEYNTEKHLADGPTGGDCLTTAFEPPPIASSSAKHVLLTGATGFLGRHVLKELLLRDDSTVVVCLVREGSEAKISQSSRVKVATNVPLNVEYKAVFHLAANVNHVLDYQSLKESNVDMTASLLRLRLAPMVYCSTSSTRQGTPPFPDGYTQTKWESEQMVQRSGGTCVWPPFLLWGNHRDWFTRLVQHCVKAGVFPVELGFLVAAPVEQTAKELVSGVPCSALELDLGHFFSLLQREVHMKPVSLRGFVAGIRRDPTSAAFSIVPLLAESKRVGNPSVGHLKPFPLCETDVRNLLRVVL